LALFALAIQFALSFGHVHLDRVAVPDASAASLAAQSSGDGPNGSSKPGSHRLADDYCAICALVQLAASSAPAAAPTLPPPALVSRVWHAPVTDFELAALPRLLFQARAPPIA
jgi:hypothetical protein